MQVDIYIYIYVVKLYIYATIWYLGISENGDISPNSSLHRENDDQTAPGVPYFGALGDGPKEYVSGHGLDDTECTRVPMELVLPKAAATVSLNHQWWFFTIKTSGGSTTIDDKMVEAAMKFNQLNHHWFLNHHQESKNPWSFFDGWPSSGNSAAHISKSWYATLGPEKGEVESWTQMGFRKSRGKLNLDQLISQNEVWHVDKCHKKMFPLCPKSVYYTITDWNKCSISGIPPNFYPIVLNSSQLMINERDELPWKAGFLSIWDDMLTVCGQCRVSCDLEICCESAVHFSEFAFGTQQFGRSISSRPGARHTFFA